MSSRVSIKKHSWPEADTGKGKYAKSKTGKILFTTYLLKVWSRLEIICFSYKELVVEFGLLQIG